MAKRVHSSSPLSEPLPCATRHKVVRDSAENESVEWNSRTTFSVGDLREAVRTLISSCTPGVWLRILPLCDDDDDSLCFHTGVEWADFQPCLHECGLVTTPGHLGGKLTAPTSEWEHFAAASAGLFEVGTARRIRGRNSVFVMRKPEAWEDWMHRRPISQMNAQYEVQPLEVAVESVEEQLRRYFRRGRIHFLSKPMENAIAAIMKKSSVSYLVHPASNVACEAIRSAEPIGAEPGRAVDVAAATVTPDEKTKARIDDEDGPKDWVSMRESAMEQARLLDFKIRPRPSRKGTNFIELHDCEQPNATHRVFAIYAANHWGWSDRRLDDIARQRIAEAACLQVSYDLGYLHPMPYARLPEWDKELENACALGKADRYFENPDNWK